MNASNETSSSNIDQGVTYFKVAILILLLISSFLGNGLLIITIATRKKLRSPSNTYILGLAVCDLLFACCYVVTMDVGIHGVWRFGYSACVANALLLVSMAALSLFHMMVIAVTRYIHVCRPHVSPRIEKFTVTVVVEVAVWVTGTTLVCLPGESLYPLV